MRVPCFSIGQWRRTNSQWKWNHLLPGKKAPSHQLTSVDWKVWHFHHKLHVMCQLSNCDTTVYLKPSQQCAVMAADTNPTYTYTQQQPDTCENQMSLLSSQNKCMTRWYQYIYHGSHDVIDFHFGHENNDRESSQSYLSYPRKIKSAYSKTTTDKLTQMTW